MFFHKLHIVLAPLARSDIKDIFNYTLTQWGEQQQKSYKQLMGKALQDIKDYPQSGKAVSDLIHGLRSKKAGKHVIFYCIDGSAIHILRVLHERMDVMRHLKELPPSFQERASLAYKANIS